MLHVKNVRYNVILSPQLIFQGVINNSLNEHGSDRFEHK